MRRGRRQGQPETRPIIDTAGTLKERLYAKIRKDPSGCWIWTGSVSGFYGQISIGSRSDGTRRLVQASRASYHVHHGPIHNNLFVCHRCDNKLCVNPDHLFLGTHQENLDDMKAKGRESHNAGELNGQHKLTAEQVQAIRRDQRHAREVAADFGVSISHVGHIRCRRVWRDLPDQEAA